MISLKIGGFTPVVDSISEELGLVGAAVYGVVWRHCQMERHVCDASLDTLAAKIGASRATVKRHIKDLCKKGYLTDLTPERLNGTHTYVVTDKVIFDGTIQARERDSGRSEESTGVLVGQSDPPVGQSDPPPVGQSDPQGDSSKRQVKERGSPPSGFSSLKEKTPVGIYSYMTGIPEGKVSGVMARRLADLQARDDFSPAALEQALLDIGERKDDESNGKLKFDPDYVIRKYHAYRSQGEEEQAQATARPAKIPPPPSEEWTEEAWELCWKSGKQKPQDWSDSFWSTYWKKNLESERERSQGATLKTVAGPGQEGGYY